MCLISCALRAPQKKLKNPAQTPNSLDVSRRNERYIPKIKVPPPKFPGRVVRISFPRVFASSLVVTLTYAEMSTEKSRFLRAHGHGHGHGHGRASGGEGRHGERRGGAKRVVRGLKTRKRPQMMVMMARVAFLSLKTKNGAAIAVRDGGHDIGRADPTSWASARASTASGSHRRRT